MITAQANRSGTNNASVLIGSDLLPTTSDEDNKQVIACCGNGYGDGSFCTIPVGSTRKLTLYIRVNALSYLKSFAMGYRRIGTNT